MKPSYETNMFKLFIHEIEIDAYTCDILSMENHEKGFNVIFKYRKDLSHMSRFFQRRQGREGGERRGGEGRSRAGSKIGARRKALRSQAADGHHPRRAE